MRTIGFVGLGVMGAPMAHNLVKAGFHVVGHSRRPSGADRLVAAGGRYVRSVAEATRGADAVITMLPDSPDVTSVVLGGDGVLAHSDPGTLIIDMSTVRPQTAREIATAATAAGREALDAPVSGGEQGAIEGVLSIMVGGTGPAFARARPIFEALGTTIVHAGPAGAGQLVKAANQLVVAGAIELVAEAIVLLEAAGVDPVAGLRVLGGGLAGSTVLARKGTAMLERRFAPGFRVDLHHKDLGIVLEAAREANVVVPVGELVAQLMADLREQGFGSLDHGVLLRGVEHLSRRPPSRPPIRARPTTAQASTHPTGTDTTGTTKTGAATPGTATPGTATSSAATTSTATPSTATPNADTPGTATPNADTPGAATTGAATTGAATPNADTPSTATPSTATPSTATPSATTPGTDTTSAATTGTATPSRATTTPGANRPGTRITGTATPGRGMTGTDKPGTGPTGTGIAGTATASSGRAR